MPEIKSQSPRTMPAPPPPRNTSGAGATPSNPTKECGRQDPHVPPTPPGDRADVEGEDPPSDSPANLEGLRENYS